MIYETRMHESVEGELYPSGQVMEDLIDVCKISINRFPHEDHVAMVFTDEVIIDTAFSHGWFFGKPTDEDVYVLTRDGREVADEGVPEGVAYDGHFRRTARMAAMKGIQAYQEALKVFNKEEE